MNRPTPPGYKSRLPQVAATALDTPERVIEYCRAHGLLSDLENTNIEELIKRDKNIKLVFEDLGEKDAYIMRNGEDQFTIGIHVSHHKNRQRFSMAHEYAHYQLHRKEILEMKVGEQILHRDGTVSLKERQANSFAAEILMPKSSVEMALKKAGNNLTEAARLLGVSVAALDFRLTNLGIRNGR